MAENIIEIRGLANIFGTQVVHQDLNLDVRRGEILSVIGGSGTGKSVLLRSIVGLIQPAAGEIRVFGQDMLSLPAAQRSALVRRFGVLFQKGALYSSLTVAENVAFPLTELAGLPHGEALRQARQYLALAGLPSHAGDKYPPALSGGMIKRAAMARALALSPEILMLDEPTAGLDPVSAAAFDNMIAVLRDALGVTVFLVTHDLDTLHALSDRVAVLADKKVLVADTLEVVSHQDNPWIKDYFAGPRGRMAATAWKEN
ncbi:ABC transporter ATP-binding protein [Shimwellia blattae]|uniref:ABC transporter n=1 Tax=Shimwellia blattae (strain ATCC 29907 / DSM 4481 / JCM 1650 / NBRC 105725 / CDC 9005-74) TaxID=630626 RepID=I2B9J9_SHIBC|nr:ATP-binding cassette domain-containing protein [Shimwellia blattae]AFJ47203.1 ABC transporter [Shimwellia blattae DSM 4481 = NBRC 105725]GAB82268.1 putative ABC transporter ATP-binding protein [Shimwellia blattae DSM 4481 = NBRC 105725]VDY64691.1 Methionine import ATP-binding protein MetN [Shimwellia blattae]VEC22795.1 Methionine import ATP-binding protein MetN [Shimwellia blattae]